MLKIDWNIFTLLFIQCFFFFFFFKQGYLFIYLFVSEFCPLHLVEKADIGPDY